MLTRPDVVLRAHEIGAGLTDRERIALGTTLVQTVLSPRYHPEVAYVAAQLHDHAAALRDAHFDLEIPGAPIGRQATTHEQTGSPGSCGGALPQSPVPHLPTSSPAGVARDRFSTSLAALADSRIGDGIGGVCLVLILIAALFAPLFMPV